MITLFGKSYNKKQLDETLNNQNVFNIISKVSKEVCSPNFDIQKIRRTVDARFQCLQVINTFNDILKKEATQQDKTQAYRSVEKLFPIQLVVRGDGNCFYRSFIVNYIIKLIFYQSKEEFCQLIERIWQFNDYQIEFDSNLIKMTTQDYKLLSISFLFDAFMKKSQNCMNIHSFIDLYNNQPEVDLSLIVICRNFIKQQFNQNNRNPSKVFFIEDRDRVEIPKLLNKYGSEAQDTIMIFSSNAFNCILRLQSLYRDKRSKMVTTLDTYNAISPNDQTIVEVLYTQGHYNIIFDHEFSDNFLKDILNKDENKQSEQTGLLKSISGKFQGIFKSSGGDAAATQQLQNVNKFIQKLKEPLNLDKNDKTQSISNDQPNIQKSDSSLSLNWSQDLSNQQSNIDKLSSQNSNVTLNNLQQALQQQQSLKQQQSWQQPPPYQQQPPQQQQSFQNQKQNSSQQQVQGRTSPFLNNSLSQSSPSNDSKRQSEQSQRNESRLQKGNSQNKLIQIQDNEKRVDSIQQGNQANTIILQEANQKRQQNLSSGSISNISQLIKHEKINTFKSQDILHLQENQRHLPKLFKRDNCDICDRPSMNGYNLYYASICQECVIQNLFAEIHSKKNQEVNMQILADILRIMKEDQLCLICLRHQPYEVTIERDNTSALQQFTCGQCQKQDPKPEIYEQYRNFYLQISKILWQKPKQKVVPQPQHLQNSQSSSSNQSSNPIMRLISGGVQQVIKILSGEEEFVQIKDSYRERIQRIISQKEIKERDQLIQKLALYLRFSDSCFKCESTDITQFRILLSNNGSIKLCVRCISELDNIHKAMVGSGVISLYCSLIDQEVILNVHQIDTNYYYKIKNSCYQCQRYVPFPLEVKENMQLCFGCLSSKQEYLQDDNKLIKLVKNQFRIYQKCLGCNLTLSNQECKVLRPVYLCRVCLDLNFTKDERNNFVVYNRHYERNFKVSVNEICDYIIDDNDKIQYFPTESSTEQDSQDTDSIISSQQSLRTSNKLAVECPKCNPQPWSPQLYATLKCSCKSSKSFKIETIKRSEDENIYCLVCCSMLDQPNAVLECDSLSNQSILQYQSKDKLKSLYYFKRNIRLVICKKCKYQQQIEESYKEIPKDLNICT